MDYRIYWIGKPEDGHSFFFNLETLWKSFVYSYHGCPGECKRVSLMTFQDPNGNKYDVHVGWVFSERQHL